MGRGCKKAGGGGSSQNSKGTNHLRRSQSLQDIQNDWRCLEKQQGKLCLLPLPHNCPSPPPFKPPQMVASPNQTSHINTQRPEVWGRLMHTLLHFSTLQGKHCSCFGMLRCPGRGIVNGRVIVYESRLRTLFGVIVQVL